MPPGMTPPTILQYNASNVQVAQLTRQERQPGEQELFDYGLNFLRLRLFTIPGLSTPAPYGGRQPAGHGGPRPAQAAAATGVSPQDVVTAIATQQRHPAGRQARIGGTEYDVLHELVAADASRSSTTMPLKVVNGMTVLLGRRRPRPRRLRACRRTSSTSTAGARPTCRSCARPAPPRLTVVDSVRELLPSIKASAPKGADLSIDFDQSVFVRAAIGSVLREAVIAAALVSLMILFFLGSWRSVVIVCTSIPIALAGRRSSASS